MEDSLLRIEKTLAQLRQTLSRLLLKCADDAHLPSSSSSSSEAAAGDNFRQRLRRPFILHQNQWRCLLDSYQQLFRHIDNVLLTILQAPLQSLLFAMESAERSFEECIAPHIYESVYDVNNRSPHIIASFHENTSDPDRRPASDSNGHGDDASMTAHDVNLTKEQLADPDRRPALDSHGDGDDGRMTADDVNLTKEQLADLELWMMKKALKHGLSGEVKHLHMENLRTCAIAVFESLTNYSASSDDLVMAFEPQTWQTADVETTTTQLQHRSRARNVEDLDLDLAQRFFGQQLKRSIMHSPCTLAIAQLVCDRISLCSKVEHSQRAPNTTATAIAKSMMERLKVAPDQFSYIKHKGEKVKVGQGQSSVFLKTWMLESHRVAVKEVVVEEDTDTSSSHQKLQVLKGVEEAATQVEEAATQARLYHPNLLPLLCVTHEQWNDRICLPDLDASIKRSGDMDLQGVIFGGDKKHIVGLVMEHMFCDLGKMIKFRRAIIHKRGKQKVVPFPLHVSVDIMLQIAKAMEHLHHHGIMHRDLKPANILISLDSDCSLYDDNRLFFRVKIADFGCSKALASTYSSSSTSMPEENTANVGTGFYRAPEVMKVHQTEDPTYSKRVDIYSFALVCYQVITGRVPFEEFKGDAPRSVVLDKIQKENYRPAFHEHESVCPAALVDMIQCCWHADSSQRPNFAQIASFLSYVKACAVPLLGSGGDNSEVNNWKKALVQIFHREKLFSAFRSNDRRGSNKMIEMCMEMRRMIMVERGYSWVAGSGGAEKKPVSSDHDSSASLETEDDICKALETEDDIYKALETEDDIYKERDFSQEAGGAEKKPVSHGRQEGFVMGGSGQDDSRGWNSNLKDAAKFFNQGNIYKLQQSSSLTALGRRRLISVADMRVATNDFDYRNVIRNSVYKGTLKDGREVAIKVIYSIYSAPEKQFGNEAKLIMDLQHKNLIPLLGYGADERRWYLVYDYLSNGSLDKHLFDESNGEFKAISLNWTVRFNIIRGIANGLKYLHEKRIVHQDIKAANILLDANLEAKITDFGFPRPFSDPLIHFFKNMSRLSPYMAPDGNYLKEAPDGNYLTEGKALEKVDVYRFGLLTLEIVIGRRATKGLGILQDILKSAWDCYERNDTSAMVDKRISGLVQDNGWEMELMVHVALLCTQGNKKTPSMSQVCHMLECQSIPDIRPLRPTWL